MRRSTFLALALGAPLAFFSACSDQPTSSSGSDPLMKPPGGGTSTPAAPVIVYKTTTTVQKNTYRALAVMNADGSNKTNVYDCGTTSAHISQFYGPSWSPSGNGTAASPWMVSFVENAGTNPGTIKLMRRDVYLSNGVPTGTNTMTLATWNWPLANGDLGFYDHAWSPSTTNAQIALLRSSGSLASDSRYEIQVVPAAGGEVTSAYTSPDGVLARAFAWSPDASKIAVYEAAYVSGNPDGNVRIAIIDLATGTVSQILLEGTYLRMRGLSWSSDGNTLAFGANTPPNSTFYVYTLSLASGSTPVQRIIGYVPCWSPDGTALVYQAGDGVRKLTLASGTSVILYSSSGYADFWPNHGFPDWRR